MEMGLSEPDKQISRRTLLKGIFSAGILAALEGCRYDTDKLDGQEPMHNNAEFKSTVSWEQDFSIMPNGSLDTSIWRYELNPAVPTYNDESQAYTNSERNVRIEGGTLIIESHRESYQYPGTDAIYEFTSGRIDTLGHFDFEYGKCEVTMRLPDESGTWPAFWFLSANQPFTNALNPTTEKWDEPRFYMHNGELDVVEAYGNRPGVVEGALHTFNKSYSFGVPIIITPDEFHTYGVEVTPTEVRWTIDSEVFGRYIKSSDSSDDWPFGSGNRIYPILNLAMGSAAGEIKVDQNNWQMQIRSIKFFEYDN